MSILFLFDIFLEHFLVQAKLLSQLRQNTRRQRRVVVILGHLRKVDVVVDLVLLVNNQAPDIQQLLVGFQILGRDALLALEPT
jgi:hypothetical protein